MDRGHNLRGQDGGKTNGMFAIFFLLNFSSKKILNLSIDDHKELSAISKKDILSNICKQAVIMIACAAAAPIRDYFHYTVTP